MSSRKLFGTDGVRGRANSHPMTAELALRLGVTVGLQPWRGPVSVAETADGEVIPALAAATEAGLRRFGVAPEVAGAHLLRPRSLSDSPGVNAAG